MTETIGTMKVGSLFTGYGGLDIAVGGELAWYAEIEPAACQVLAHHYPNIPNLGDITKIDWDDVEPVDVITGGYPCQPFSHAGNRKGKNDVRHLWPNVLDAIRAIRPTYAILENVSGHLTLGFADVLADLAEIGWDAEWGTFRASDVGAPHLRERIFIIAHTSRGIGGTGQGRDHQESEGATGLATHVGASVANTSGDGHGQQLHARGIAGVEGQTTGSTQQRERTRRKSDAGSVDDAADTDSTSSETRTGRQGRGDTGRFQPVECGGSVAADTDMQTGRKTVSGVQAVIVPKDRTRFDAEISRIDWGKYAPAIARWESVLERIAPDPVVMRSDKRRLNPRFVEWMMGLPDGWVTGHGLSAAKELKMLGNGVVPLQAYEAITQLLKRTQQ
jgi:DNA (cytosine-5)-methyltransferase 1